MVARHEQRPALASPDCEHPTLVEDGTMNGEVTLAVSCVDSCDQARLGDAFFPYSDPQRPY